MSNVAVLTDSTASLPEEMLANLNIRWVAYYIHRGQEVLRDLVSIQRDEFLRWLAGAEKLPTTASPGPGDYAQAYEELIAGGQTEIISIHITSNGSGAYQAAVAAREMVLEQHPQAAINVIDSRNVSLCQGWMVIEAARAALAGRSLNEITALVQRMIPVTRMIQTASTLKYLYMGGRIGQAQRLMGTLLNIKPLIGMKDGVIVPLGQARSLGKAYAAMADMVEAAVGPQGKIKIAYVHAGALEEVEKIKALVESRITAVESFFAELSPALAVHSGPGTAGLCYFPTDVLEK
jgi:DegV family protein with EDD domain